MTALAVVAALCIVLLLWLWGSRASHLPAGDRPAPIRLEAADGWVLWVHHRPAQQRRFREPVLLCNGLANNHRCFDFEPPSSFAHALAAAGFEVYSAEFRGALQAAPGPTDPRTATIDTYIQQDAPALVKAVLAHSGAPQLFWMGHSLGGLIGLAAASTQGLEPSLRGLITLGSPVFFTERQRRLLPLMRLGLVLALRGRVRLDWLATLVAPLAGWAPAPFAGAFINARNMTGRTLRAMLASAIAPIWTGVLAQLIDWVQSDAYRSADKALDYRAGLPALRLPMLVFAGEVDGLCAPQAVERHLALLRSADVTTHVLGVRGGERDDYGHGDLLVGRRVDTEVFPRLISWLGYRATPIDGSPVPHHVEQPSAAAR